MRPSDYSFLFVCLFVFPPFPFVNHDVSHSSCLMPSGFPSVLCSTLMARVWKLVREVVAGFKSVMANPPYPPSPTFHRCFAEEPRLGSCFSFTQGADSAKEEKTQEFPSGTSSFLLSRRVSERVPTLVEVLCSSHRSVFSEPQLECPPEASDWLTDRLV